MCVCEMWLENPTSWGVRVPLFIGIEAVGVVIAVGPGLTDWQVGVVVAYALNPMGSYAEEQILPSDRVELIFCRIDRTNFCPKQRRNCYKNLLKLRIIVATVTIFMLHPDQGPPSVNKYYLAPGCLPMQEEKKKKEEVEKNKKAIAKMKKKKLHMTKNLSFALAPGGSFNA
uniref:Alcohol dehydrogenase superfamily, zinc-type n=1 Tax=Tanacetum cinerariifolium TaxID=118510 RepID=A0A699GXN9_TANCI|nr:alcohol dehydrogenase superfamily, zinc-type [Tanacetum cinerariifolium]